MKLRLSTFRVCVAFTKNIRYCDIEQSCRGITWIELYILFRISGHPKVFDEEGTLDGHKIKNVIPLDKQLA